jgi:hypothetical protein
LVAGTDLRRGDRAHRTGVVRALGYAFTVGTSDATLGAYLAALFAPMTLAPGGNPAVAREAHHYRVSEDAVRQWEVTVDDALVVRTPEPSEALAMLLWHVNGSVVEHTPDLTLVHAAAAARDGAAVVLPGAMEAGKTTLVAALLRAGLAYLTDEITAIDPASLRVMPYPKALSVDPGSWDVLSPT